MIFKNFRGLPRIVPVLHGSLIFRTKLHGFVCI
jgi:hypothetical protein